MIHSPTMLSHWSNSYFLELFGIRIEKHYIWLRDKDISLILMQRPSDIRFNQDITMDKKVLDSIERLRRWIKIAEIDISASPSFIYIKDEPLFPLVFLNPEEFFINL